VYWIVYTVILVVNSPQMKIRAEIDGCRTSGGSGYSFICCEPGETCVADGGGEVEDSGTLSNIISSMYVVYDKLFVILFVAFCCAYVSYKNEATSRRNFKTVQTSIIQQNIMNYNAIQNQKMLLSMLPESMIEKFKSKDSSVVVDT
jgi:hypothetical protein